MKLFLILMLISIEAIAGEWAFESLCDSSGCKIWIENKAPQDNGGKIHSITKSGLFDKENDLTAEVQALADGFCTKYGFQQAKLQLPKVNSGLIRKELIQIFTCSNETFTATIDWSPALTDEQKNEQSKMQKESLKTGSHFIEAESQDREVKISGKYEKNVKDAQEVMIKNVKDAQLQTTNVIGSLTKAKIPANSYSLGEFKKECADLGFKSKTPAFGNCVLELRRGGVANSSQEAQKASPTQITVQAKSTANYEEEATEFYRRKEEEYQRRNNEEYARRVAEYERQKADYDARVAEAESEKERQKGLKLLELGLRMSAGQSIGDASIATAGMAPLRPLMPNNNSFRPSENYRITTPSGGLINCRYDPNIRRAVCY